MSDNKLEKLTFVTLFDRPLQVCVLSRDQAGGLPGIAKETSELFARFQASYCAENMVLLVTRTAYDSRYWEFKWLPDKSIQTITGLDISAAVEKIYVESRAWQEQIEKLAFANIPELMVTQSSTSTSPNSILKDVADQVNAGALGPNITATVTPSPRNKKAR